MKNIINFAKSQSLKLTPFFNSVLVYFVFVQNPNGELWTTLLKCAPIVFLILYILLNGIEFTSDYKYSQRIVFGLIFSCGGDALLNVNLFPHGMLSFALAQIFYISAFGWDPLKLYIGVPLYIGGALVFAVTFNSLDQILIIGMPIYTCLLLTMCWRSIARAICKSDFLVTFCAFGSLAFVLSDCLIAIDMFYMTIPNARIYIMVTYYFAQFAIALSTANESQAVKCEPIFFRQSLNKPFSTDEASLRRANKLKD